MENKDCHTIAIVSGKGGSGKTMLTATIATILDKSNFSTLLIDADFGTAGLTYYLGLNEVSNISVGLTNIFSTKKQTALSYDKLIENLKSYNNIDFIGVGDHRRHNENDRNDFFHDYFNHFINQIKDEGNYDYIIIDCRGGIDDDSVTVCKSADDIIIVAETDTTSFQATQYLVDTLYDNGVSDKLNGFFVNKVFDNPSILIRNGVVSFKTRCLSSIPFDLDAIKSFMVGEIPKTTCLYTNQIWHGLKDVNAFERLPSAPNKKLSSKQFSIFSFKDKSTSLGSYFISMALFVLITIVTLTLFANKKFSMDSFFLLFPCLVLSVATISDNIKKFIGRLLFSISSLMLKK